jgi:hypothetical protein
LFGMVADYFEENIKLFCRIITKTNQIK